MVSPRLSQYLRLSRGRGELLDLTPLAKYTLGIKVVPMNQANKVEPNTVA